MNRYKHHDDDEMNIWTAARTGDINLLDMRIHYGDGIDAEDDYGTTPLMIACFHGHMNIVKSLLDRGAKISTTDTHGYSALICACSQGHFDIVKLLLKQAAWLIKVNDRGVDALLAACYGEHADIVDMLIELGADVTGLRGYSFSATIKSIIEDSRRIRARYRLKLWRAATRTWCISNFWWKVAGEGQHAPGERGHMRACSEFARDAAES